MQCAGSRLLLLLLQCCWCEYWRVMRCYTRPADTLHTHNTNTSCDYYKCVSTVGHSSCNFLIFTNKTVIICPHHRTQPGQPPHTLAWPVPAPGDTGTRATLSDHLYCFSSIILPSLPFCISSLHFKLTVVHVTPLSLAAGPARLANAAQVSGLMEDMMTAVVITVEVMVISTKQTT